MENLAELKRRLAAVWFADIVGFTRLSSQDERKALRLVGMFQEMAGREIDRHEGTLVKFIGDGVLAHAGSTASAIDTASRRFEVVTSTINTLPDETLVGTIANSS